MNQFAIYALASVEPIFQLGFREMFMKKIDKLYLWFHSSLRAHMLCAQYTQTNIRGGTLSNGARESAERALHFLYSFRCFACGLEATIVVSIKWCFLFIHMYFLHVNSVAACCYGQMYASYTCRRLKCILLCEKVW